MPDQIGCLYVVATPIGNLGDLSPRAAEVLGGVDVIAAEDTRHSAKLLAHAQIQKAMIALHEHNEDRIAPSLIRRMQAGETVAMIADAGTPLISDPGFVLVRAARTAGVAVRTVPGACAAVAALAVSGLASDRFLFEGFLPAKATGRRRRLSELANEPSTLLLYESSHRIAHAVRDLAAIFGANRPVCLARELTKLHEDSVLLPAGELTDWLALDDNRRRGEFVLVVAGAPQMAASEEYPVRLDALMRELVAVMPVREAAKAAARLLGVARNQAYAIGLSLTKSP